MKSTKKCLITGIALFITGSVWCAKTGAASAQSGKTAVKKPVAQSKTTSRAIQQPVMEVEQPMTFEMAEPAYSEILSMLKNKTPDSSDFSTLNNIQAEAGRQISMIASSGGGGISNISINKQISSNNSGRSISMPPVNLGYDIKETKDSVIVTVDVPGFNINDITVAVDDYNNMIVSSGEAKVTKTGGSTSYNISGQQSSLFKQFPLPSSVDAKRMTKKISNGVLTITLPKK